MTSVEHKKAMLAMVTISQARSHLETSALQSSPRNTYAASRSDLAPLEWRDRSLQNTTSPPHKQQQQSNLREDIVAALRRSFNNRPESKQARQSNQQYGTVHEDSQLATLLGLQRAPIVMYAPRTLSPTQGPEALTEQHQIRSEKRIANRRPKEEHLRILEQAGYEEKELENVDDTVVLRAKRIANRRALIRSQHPKPVAVNKLDPPDVQLPVGTTSVSPRYVPLEADIPRRSPLRIPHLLTETSKTPRGFLPPLQSAPPATHLSSSGAEALPEQPQSATTTLRQIMSSHSPTRIRADVSAAVGTMVRSVLPLRNRVSCLTNLHRSTTNGSSSKLDLNAFPIPASGLVNKSVSMLQGVDDISLTLSGGNCFRLTSDVAGALKRAR